MEFTIKCDHLADGWDYDACQACRHHTANVSPRNWKCTLNSADAAEKRVFWGIWANEFIRAHGQRLPEDEITVVYIGKKKRK
jgi:hypothetical protein